MKIKFCGITRLEDALLAAELNVWGIGFVFAPNRPRTISIEQAQAISCQLPKKLAKVGVFVDATVESMMTAVKTVGLDLIQLHGHESPEVVLRLQRQAQRPVIKFIPVTSLDDVERIKAYSHADYLLFDSMVHGNSGGTGVLGDLNLAKAVSRITEKPLILAGGLSAENVKEVLEQVPCDIVDVSSGIEISPGVKSAEKMRNFCDNARTATTGSKERKGYFGSFGGQFVPETLMAPLLELEQIIQTQVHSESFQEEFHHLLRTYVGRPTPLTFAKNLTQHCQGAKIYLKREDLAHLGAHKINNALGQAILAKRSGKKRVIAETGAGQHGVASAAAAALLGLRCTVYMGRRDMERQSLNVLRMRLFGAEVCGVDSGSRTLKDAINEAMRDWVTHYKSSHYLLGSVLGPHPYPTLVRNFQSVIGIEAKRQILDAEGRLADELVACVGGGSNAMGLFHAFVDDSEVSLTGVEAGGKGLDTKQHAARFAGGSLGVLHGTKSFILQDDAGQIIESHSISAGLDYPSVGPEHAHLRSITRARYTSITDEEALKGFELLARLEGIIPALESAHAVAQAVISARGLAKDKIVIVNISGRGDKDMDQIQFIKSGGNDVFKQPL